MKISELKEFISQNGLNENMNIETLIACLVTNNKIDNFTSILIAYVHQMEKNREYTKCELKETATLLHSRKLNFSFEGQSDRELHMINKHSSLSCDEEREAQDYDEAKMEENFKSIYNLK